MSLDSLPDDILLYIVTKLDPKASTTPNHSETSQAPCPIQINTSNQHNLEHLALTNKPLLQICRSIIHNNIGLGPEVVTVEAVVSTCQSFLNLLVERPHLSSYIH